MTNTNSVTGGGGGSAYQAPNDSASAPPIRPAATVPDFRKPHRANFIETKRQIAQNLSGTDLVSFALTEKVNREAVTPVLHAEHLLALVAKAGTASEYLALLNPDMPKNAVGDVQTDFPNNVFGLKTGDLRSEVLYALLQKMPRDCFAATDPALHFGQVRQAFMGAVQKLRPSLPVELLRQCIGGFTSLSGRALCSAFDNMRASTAHLGDKAQQIMSGFAPVVALELRTVAMRPADKNALLDRLQELVDAGPLEPPDLEKACEHLIRVVAPRVHGFGPAEYQTKLHALMDHMIGQQASMTPYGRGIIASNLAYSLVSNAPFDLNEKLLDHLDTLTQHDLGSRGDVALSNLIDTLLDRQVEPVHATEKVVALIERLASRELSVSQQTYALWALQELQRSERDSPYLGGQRLGRLQVVEQILSGPSAQAASTGLA